MSRLKDIFVAESLKNLKILTEAIDKLLANSENAELKNEIARILHTLKGSSRMLGYKEFSNLIHSIENHSTKLKNNEIQLDEDIAIFFKEIGNILTDLVKNIDNIDTKIVEEAIVKIDNLSNYKDISKITELFPTSDKIDSDDSKKVSLSALEKNHIEFADETFGNLINDIKSVIAYNQRGLDDLNKFTAVEKELNSLALDIIKELSFEKGDYFKFKISNIINQLKHTKYNIVKNLNNATNRLKSSYYKTTSHKLIKAELLFETLKKSADEIAKELGKKIEITLKGSKAKIDKSVAINIQELIIQLVRNSIDHGIESKKEREALNKPEYGHILIEFIPEKNNLKIIIEDDGKGVDKEKILEKVKTEDNTIKSLDNAQIANIIFSSGFSTKEKATETSGRGVGLDIVKRNIEKLGGNIFLEFEKNKFTRFVITIPISDLYTNVTVFKYADFKFGIISNYVEATEKIDTEKILKSHNTFQYKYKNKNYPLASFGDISKLPIKNENDVIILKYNNNFLCLSVENVLFNENFNVVSLSESFKNLESYSHCAISHTEEIIPILSPAFLFDKFSTYKVKFTAKLRKTKKKKILLVEDSFATRELEKHILVNAGFEVIEATDGKDGLEKLKSYSDLELIISDVEMPVMNGFQFVKTIRSTPSKYQNMPIIMVSTLADEESINNGLEAGANYFITKGEFSKDDFLTKIKALVGEDV
ncbi:response regulator [Deferribacteraceae bacterium V6Fe1]|nr:response regulator [Deferribacteraceae bacterium V6Fe1]